MPLWQRTANPVSIDIPLVVHSKEAKRAKVGRNQKGAIYMTDYNRLHMATIVLYHLIHHNQQTM